MRLFGILAILAAMGTAAFGQTNAPDTRKLALEDCIEIALHHNLDVQISRYNPEINLFALQGAYGAYDPVFSLSGEHGSSRSPGGVTAEGLSFPGTETESDSFSAGLSGLTPWGTTYSLSGNVTDQYGNRPGVAQDFSRPTITTNNIFDLNTSNTISFLSVSFPLVQTQSPFETTSGRATFLQIRQPLLKNFWIDGTRLQILLDRKTLQISEIELRGQVMTTVTAVENAYYTLIAARENIIVQQKAVELAERQLSENRKRVEVGAMAPLEEKQAESLASQSRADLINALGNEETRQRALKILLSDNYDDWKNVSIEPTEKLVAIPERFNLQESWRKALKQNTGLISQKLSRDKQEQVVRFSKNQLYPQLDLIGTAGYGASAGEFSGAFSQVANRDNPFWSGGAQITFPLTQRTARNNYRSAKASQEQLDLIVKKNEQTVLIGVEDAIASANTAFQAVGARREARIYAEAALDAGQKKLESGKATSFEVLSLTRDLTRARSDEILALTQYNIELALLSLAEGTTFERRHITLEWRKH